MSFRYEFDWDPAKATSNKVKHDVLFDDAVLVFGDPLALSRLEDGAVSNEDRWVTIGLNPATGLLLVVHTFVEIAEDHAYIRIISARKPTKREKRHYEQFTN